MPNQSPFPSKDAELNLYFEEAVTHLLEYKERLNVSKEHQEQLPVYYDAWKVVFPLSQNKNTKTMTIVDNKNIAKDANGEGVEDNKAYDLALTYKEGPVDFAAAYERYEENAAIGAGERDGFRIAGAYKFTPELNVGALYQLLTHDNETANPDAQVFGVAADYKVAPKTYVRGQVFHRDVDTDDANSTLLAVGVEHRLDKAVRVYANLATMLNDKNSNLVPWKEARSNSVSGEDDENATALSLGFRYDF